MGMTLLVVAADAREFAGITQRTGPGELLPFGRRVRCGDSTWLLTANGPGPRLAAEACDAAMRSARVDAVLSTGYCGALDPALEIASIVPVSRIIDRSSGEVYETQYQGGETLVCQDRVAATTEEKATLRRETGAGAVDMESAAVARKALEAGLPLHCIRVVSDTAAEGFELDLNAARGSDGRFRISRILLQALVRPWRSVPGLIRLASNSHRASERLGEFLATCQF